MNHDVTSRIISYQQLHGQAEAKKTALIDELVDRAPERLKAWLNDDARMMGGRDLLLCPLLETGKASFKCSDAYIKPGSDPVHEDRKLALFAALGDSWEAFCNVHRSTVPVNNESLKTTERFTFTLRK